MSTFERQYIYRTSRSTAVIGLLLSAATAFFIYQAIYNDQSVVLYRLFELTPTQGSVAFGILGIMSAMLAIFSLMSLTKIKPQYIRLTDRGVTVPKTLFRMKELLVPYNEITQIWQSEVYGQIFLNIHHKNGKFAIVSSMLRSTTELQEISKLL